MLGINNFFTSHQGLDQQKVKKLEASIYKIFDKAGYNKDRILGNMQGLGRFSIAESLVSQENCSSNVFTEV